jgi:hypothetical protein
MVKGKLKVLWAREEGRAGCRWWRRWLRREW